MNTFRRLASLTFIACAVASSADTFKLTVTNHGPQPLSPVFFSAGTADWDIFTEGEAASAGIKDIAEAGDARTMARLAGLSRGSVTSFGIIGSSPQRSMETRSVFFEADAFHDHFSFATMLGKTNDGFIGESASTGNLHLYQNGVAAGWTLEVTGSRVWDAGTEVNTQNGIDLPFRGGLGNPLEYGVIGFHRGIEAGKGDSWTEMPSWSDATHLATVTLTVVPEPSTALLVLFGLAPVVARRSKRRS